MTTKHASNELVKDQAAGKGDNKNAVIRGYVERLEAVDVEMQDLRDAKKSIKNEAKDNDIKSRALNEVIKLRKMDNEVRIEYEDEVDEVKLAMGMLPHFEAAEEVAKSKQSQKAAVGTTDAVAA